MGFVKPAQAVINSNRRASATSQLKFPISSTSHSIVLSFKTYTTDSGGTSVIRPSDSIILPLPKSLQDSQGVDVSPEALGFMGALSGDIYKLAGKSDAQLGAIAKSMGSEAANAAINLMEGGGHGINRNNLSDFAMFAIRNGLTVVGRNVEQGIGVASGTAINPHQALVFNGVQLKRWTFEWSLIPESEREVDRIAAIIRRLKKGSLPRYSDPLSGAPITGLDKSFGRALLRYPDVVDVFFTGLDQESFPKFKTGMISEINTNYTPNGHFVLNKGRTGSKPAAIDLMISFTENEIHTADEYTDSAFGGGR